MKKIFFIILLLLPFSLVSASNQGMSPDLYIKNAYLVQKSGGEIDVIKILVCNQGGRINREDGKIQISLIDDKGSGFKFSFIRKFDLAQYKCKKFIFSSSDIQKIDNVAGNFISAEVKLNTEDDSMDDGNWINNKSEITIFNYEAFERLYAEMKSKMHSFLTTANANTLQAYIVRNSKLQKNCTLSNRCVEYDIKDKLLQIYLHKALGY